MKITKKRNRKLLKSFLLMAFYLLPLIAMAQTRTISGVVADETNEPLIGVSVVVKGTTTGTLTDIEGKYTINAPNKESVLVFSYIGYTLQEQKVGEKVTIDVILKEDNKLLDEVVVVGYGVQKKVNLTGSVAAVQADKIENRAAPNLSTMLTGLASGVSVRQGSGNPGSDEANIRIRGIGTFDGDYRSPLVIVDGAEADMNSLNPEDVESVSVLKDAASAAIYGSRGANGVILVTTKKGRKNVAPKVTYTGILSRTTASRVFDFISDYAEYMELYNMAEFSANPKAISTYDANEIAAWRAAKSDRNGLYTDPDTGNQVPNYLAYPNTNWSDILFAPTHSQKHTLSVSGGSQSSNYLMSLGYFEAPGTLENTGIDQFNVRVNIESQITKFLKIGTQTYAMRQRKDPGNLDQVNTYRFQTVGGIVPIHDGKYGGPESPNEKNDVRNPLRDVNAIGGKNTTTRINTTWYTEAELYKNLVGRASINYQNYFYEKKNHSRHFDSYTFRKGTISIPGTSLANATTTRAYEKQEQYTANITLNYNTTFADNHYIGAMLGYEQFYFNRSGVSARRKGLLNFDVPDITTGAEMDDISGNPGQEKDENKPEMDYAMLSYFGRLNYAYKNRYLFEANFRRDGASRFSPDNRWGTFPSFSAGWRINEEPFFEPLRDKISNLKLRASWGKLGNTTSGYYDWRAVYVKANYALGNVISDGAAISKIANALLKWESVTSTGIGLDASFLDSRLSLEFDYYNKLTKGILTSPAMYLTMGTATAPTLNTSDMRNKGLEITIGWNDKIGNVRYAVSGNFSYNTNKVVKYLGNLNEGWVEENGKMVYKSNLGEASTTGSETGSIRVEGHMFDEYYLRKRYKGTGTYYNSDGSVNPGGGPKDGMIRTEADLKWVQDMIAAKYSFNGAAVKQDGGLWYGEYIYGDLNNDGNYGNTYDREFTGKSAAPKYNFGLNLSAEWKGFDISMTWAGAGGFWYYLRERGANKNNLASKTDVLPLNTRDKFYYLAYDQTTGAPIWNDPSNNLAAEYARLRTGGEGTYEANDQFLYDASYLKLKNLQIGYTFPKEWMRKAFIENLRVFVTGENLLTITSYPGVDPEIGSGLNIYPISRQLSVGVNVSF